MIVKCFIYYVTIQNFRPNGQLIWFQCDFKKIFSKCYPLAKTTKAGQAIVIYPLGQGHNTKMVKISFFNWFGPKDLLLNFQIFSDMF